MKTIGVLGLVLALTFGGGVTTVQASQNSLPNDVLYPVKLFSEDVRLSFATDPERDQELLLDYAAERIEEVVAVLETGGEVGDMVLDRLDQQYGMALENAAQLSDAELMLALQQMNAQLDYQLSQMQQMQNKSGVASQEQVQQSLRVLERNRVRVMDALEDPVSLRDRVGVERPENAPEQPENVPGEGQGSGDGTGSGEGQGSGDGSGQGGMGTENGKGSGGAGAGQMNADGTPMPGQGGQGGSQNGR